MRGEGWRWAGAAGVLAALAAGSSAAEGPAPRFDGQEIVIGVMDASAIGGPASAHALTWAARTGGKAKVIKFPYADLYGRFKTSLEGKGEPHFDVIFYAPAWAGDFSARLDELPKALAADESFDDIHPTYRDRLMRWDGRWISVTVDGDLFLGYYRKDLFEDARNREAFRQRFGYDLAPPDDWKQYRDIAEFFTGRPGPDGKPLYGTTEAFARGGQQFWDAFARASAYVNHPDTPGRQFFDPDTMAAAINNPGWVRAIEEYADIVRFTPPTPDPMTVDIVQSRRLFVGGQTAMSLDWGDTGPISANPKLSQVVDKTGFFVLPGSREVWNAKAVAWDKRAQVHKAPFLAFGGWVAAVPSNARHKPAAWDYVMWYASIANSTRDVVNGDSGVNPYRFSHFMALDAWTRSFSRRAAADYLGVLKASLDSPQAALDLRLPGFNDYTEAFEVELTRILKREVPAKDALDRVAAAWEKITDARGRAQQKILYRSSMGLR